MAAFSELDVSENTGDVWRVGRSDSLGIEKSSKKISKARKTKEVKVAPSEATVVKTNVANFRNLVQELTGTALPENGCNLSESTPVSPSFHGMKPKVNSRLKNLAPPPIRPTAVNHGFRPVPQRTGKPVSPASGSGLPNVGASIGVVPQFQMPVGIPSSPFGLWSPHILSPLPMLSPRDFFWGAPPESPGSMAMREMATLAMAQAMVAREGAQKWMETNAGTLQMAVGSGCIPPTFQPYMMPSGYAAMYPGYTGTYSGPGMPPFLGLQSGVSIPATVSTSDATPEEESQPQNSAPATAAVEKELSPVGNGDASCSSGLDCDSQWRGDREDVIAESR